MNELTHLKIHPYLLGLHLFQNLIFLLKCARLFPFLSVELRHVLGDPQGSQLERLQYFNYRFITVFTLLKITLDKSRSHRLVHIF
jgi:hypothetical protein